MVRRLLWGMIVTWLAGSPMTGQQDDIGPGPVVLVGDLQRTSFWERLIGREQNDEARTAIINGIGSRSPAAVVILGDLVYKGSSDEHWAQFNLLVEPLRSRTMPLYPLAGNHEYYGQKDMGIYNLIERAPPGINGTWYSFKAGRVAFVLLDSNFGELSDESRQKQQAWYVEALSRYESDSAINAIIVCCHHPPYTNSTIVSDNDDVQQSFVEPFLRTTKAKLFLTGHSHAYERFEKNGRHFIVSGGGGGPRHRIQTDPAKRKHDDKYPGGEIREFHFCSVVQSEDSLLFRMIRIDEHLQHWSTGDSLTIRFR